MGWIVDSNARIEYLKRSCDFLQLFIYAYLRSFRENDGRNGTPALDPNSLLKWLSREAISLFGPKAKGVFRPKTKNAFCFSEKGELMGFPDWTSWCGGAGWSGRLGGWIGCWLAERFAGSYLTGLLAGEGGVWLGWLAEGLAGPAGWVSTWQLAG